MNGLMELAWRHCWQTTLVIVLIAILARIGCKRRPHLAYALWLLVLVKGVTPPLWSSPTSLFSWNGLQASPAASSHTGLQPGSPSAVDPGAHETFREPRDQPESFPLTSQIDPPALPAAITAAPESEHTPARARFDWRLLLVIVWLAGAVAYGSYQGVLTLHFQAKLSRRHQPADPSIIGLVADLSRRLGIRREVRVWVTMEQVGPLTFGWLRPTIVIPQALLGHADLLSHPAPLSFPALLSNHDRADLVSLIGHELVHVKRGDALIGFWQVLVQSLWWFHPLVWWATRRLAFERERCCDESVISLFQVSPRQYAVSLLTVLEMRQEWRGMAALPGMRAFEINQRRLAHVLSLKSNAVRKFVYIPWLIAVGLGLLLVPGATVPAEDRPGATAEKGPAENGKATVAAANELTPWVSSDDAVVPVPDESRPVEQAAALDAVKPKAELHMLGAYWGRNDPRFGPIDVEIRETKQPVVLVVSGYYSVTWKLKLAPGAKIHEIFVFGNHEQRLEGVPEGVSVKDYSGYTRPPQNEVSFESPRYPQDRRWYAHDSNSRNYREMVGWLNAQTGLLVSTFQGSTFQGTDRFVSSFVVDGQRGREFVQAKRRVKPTFSPEPSSAELLEMSAGGELHCVGIYGAGGSMDGGLVEVDVRKTARPMILVLTSYNSVLWRLKCVPDANLKAVILGGYFEQEIEGVPEGIVVLDKFTNRRDPLGHAYQINSLAFRNLLGWLNDRTGLLVSTFQIQNRNNGFVVDGERGRENSQAARLVRSKFPPEPAPEEIQKACRGAEMHAVSIYWPQGPVIGVIGGPVDVEVQETGRPVVLVLASYMPALWRVKCAPGVKIQAVIIGGYGEQEFSGLPEGIPIIDRAFNPTRRETYFYAEKEDSPEFRQMTQALNEITGLPVATAQLFNAGGSIVVDGQRGKKPSD